MLFKWHIICWVLCEVFSEVKRVSKKRSFLSFFDNKKDDWCMNGKLRSCNLLWWYFFIVAGISLVFSERLLSCWLSVSSWFNRCINWLRPRSCFRKNWFAGSISHWRCNRERSIPAWVYSDEKLLKIVVWILPMDMVFVYWTSLNKKVLWFADGFVLFCQLDLYLVPQINNCEVIP